MKNASQNQKSSQNLNKNNTRGFVGEQLIRLSKQLFFFANRTDRENNSKPKKNR